MCGCILLGGKSTGKIVASRTSTEANGSHLPNFVCDDGQDWLLDQGTLIGLLEGFQVGNERMHLSRY